MSPIKDEFLASYSKQNSAIKPSKEGPILLDFVNLSQIFSEGLLVIPINEAFLTFNLT